MPHEGSNVAGNSSFESRWAKGWLMSPGAHKSLGFCGLLPHSNAILANTCRWRMMLAT
eukprot:SAG11_NODE_17594_length_514_cov_0.640964_1_plen_57_part_10